MRATDMFVDHDALAQRAQFRMCRLQVLNWGTFSGLHDIRIAREGFLFVGRSGSGKSTLLDALASMLVPPRWLSFNAAAREGEGSRGDRSLASYIRGAWADQRNADSGEIATSHLRRGTTWSALALGFENGDGEAVTLIQLFWLKGTSSAAADIKRHFMIVRRPFDIASEFENFDLDLRALKRSHDEALHFERFQSYAERFRQMLGIDSEMALKLLHRTQSAKNLGDLNSFLREFMLDRPDTFDAAERLVTEFAELDVAHQAVVTARLQVDTLQPARLAATERTQVEGTIAEREHLQLGIDAHADGLRHRLLTERARALEVSEQALVGEAERQQAQLLTLKSEVVALETEYRAQGGGRIEQLEADLEAGTRQRDECLQRRAGAAEACRALTWTLSDDPAGFAALQGRARAEVEDWQRAQDSAEQARDDIRDEKTGAEAEFAQLRREIVAMERQPSNIPARMLDMRRAIAEGLGLPEADLPYAGELLEVDADEQAWRGAAERVLRGFGLSLLVDEARYVAVSQYVDAHHLGGRLVYFRIGAPDVSGGRIAPGTLASKLEIRPGSHAQWLRAELARRFDHACVETMQDFRRAPRRALTRSGQVKSGPDRHEKDDRQRIDDPANWVLGFDNREKLALYQARAQALAATIADLDTRLRDLREARNTQQARQQACLRLANLNFAEIDVAPLLERVRELESELAEARTGNRTLEAIGARLTAARTTLDDTEAALRKAQVAREVATQDLARCQADLARLAAQIDSVRSTAPASVDGKAADDSPALDPRLAATIKGELEQRFRADGAVTLANIDARQKKVERELASELTALRQQAAQLEKRIERAFANFAHQWPAEAADMDTSIASLNEHMALLQRLEQDGLPRHEARFFALLREQSSELLANLNARIQQARKEIRERMEDVNAGLASAEFNVGTHLRIEVNDRQLPDVRTFRDQVRQVLEHSTQAVDDPQRAEARFLLLRELVERLGGDATEQRRWRDQVLDVRLHVEFIGHELDADDNEVEVYRSGAGKSGGQREKLATTCLAAALRYQLGGLDGEAPRYAPVVLDEAFARADNEFTELVMRIFQRFGFQMIVATPLKSVMTLEPFIGGACFVEIADRQRSSTLAIDYDTDEQRLDLPAASRHRTPRNTRAHGEDLPAGA